MPTDTPQSPDDIDLASLGGAVRKALPKVLVASAIVGAATVGIMQTMLPKYASTAQLQVVAKDGSDASAADQAAVATHVRGLKSTDLATRMVKEMGLATKPEFNNALPAPDLFGRTLQLVGLDRPRAAETDAARALRGYDAALKVSAARETRTINVEFTSSDPTLSADVANRLARLYEETLAVRPMEIGNKEADRLKPIVDRARRELADVEARLTKLRAELELTPVGPDRSRASKVLDDLLTEQTRASTARAEAESRARAAREQMAAGAAESNPEVQKSQLIPRLTEQRIRLDRQVSELSATLLPAHPRMRQVQGELQALQRQIKDEVRKVVDGLEREVSIAREKETAIARRIADERRVTVVKAPQEAELRTAEEAARNKRDDVQRLQREYDEALKNRETPAARINVETVQKAIPSAEKVFPKPAFFGPLMALATLMLGLAWAVTRELVTGSARAKPNAAVPPEQTEVARPLSVASKPAKHALAAPSKAARPKPPADTSALDETIAQLIARTEGRTGFRSLITGETAEVDAGAEAVALAKGLAAAGRQVVLVEWAPGSAAVSNLGAKKAPGLTDLMAGTVSFEEVIQLLDGSTAHLIRAGVSMADDATLYDADRANLVLDSLDEAYDHVMVCGQYHTARRLFEAVQGRFDAGLPVAAVNASAAAEGFLGFDVADLETIRIPSIGEIDNAPRRRFSTRPVVGARATA